MKEEEKKSSKSKNQTAEDVAKAMVENMKKNMEDPNFLDDKERMLQKVRDSVLKKREKKRDDN